MTDSAEEAVARAICAYENRTILNDEAEEQRLKLNWPKEDSKTRRYYFDFAQAAIAAYRQHLAEQGLVVVPREPTDHENMKDTPESMIEAGAEAYHEVVQRERELFETPEYQAANLQFRGVVPCQWLGPVYKAMWRAWEQSQ